MMSIYKHKFFKNLSSDERGAALTENFRNSGKSQQEEKYFVKGLSKEVIDQAHSLLTCTKKNCLMEGFPLYKIEGVQNIISHINFSKVGMKQFDVNGRVTTNVTKANGYEHYKSIFQNIPLSIRSFLFHQTNTQTYRILGYPFEWTKGETQSKTNVNNLADVVYDYDRYVKVRKEDICNKEKSIPLPHQMSVKFIIRPFSPITRILVVHQVGSGKSRLMLELLENHVYSGRKKIMLVPTIAIRAEIFKELEKRGTKYITPYLESHGLKNYITNELITYENGEKAVKLNDVNNILCANSEEVVDNFAEFAMRMGEEITKETKFAGPIAIMTFEEVKQCIDSKELSTVKGYSVFGSKEDPDRFSVDGAVIIVDEVHKLYRSETCKSSRIFRGKYK